MKTAVRTSPGALAQAAALLRRGELVAFPTETVYGLAADAGNPRAVRRIYQVKGRPANNPLIVHVPDAAAARRHVRHFPPAAVVLAERFWPGPLTLVLPRGAGLCREVAAGLDTVAIRAPAHRVARQLLRRVGRPLAAPSANRSGYTSPTTARHVRDELDGLIPLILDGGPCRVGLESTVLDLSGPQPVILRPGAITRAMLAGVLRQAGLPDVIGEATARKDSRPPATLKSPGRMARHYAPRTPAYRFTAREASRAARWLRRQSAGFRAVLIGFSSAVPPLTGAVPKVMRVLRWPRNPIACARRLYAILRRADAAGAQVMLVQLPPRADGLWQAITDRLQRATRELPR
jgi:L-threonylcarbamoyladenylate synthase